MDEKSTEVIFNDSMHPPDENKRFHLRHDVNENCKIEPAIMVSNVRRGIKTSNSFSGARDYARSAIAIWTYV